MKYTEKFASITNAEEFIKELETIECLEDLQDLLEDYGVTMTEEEINEMLAHQRGAAQDEISENELDDVAGGGVGLFVAKVAAGMVFQKCLDWAYEYGKARARENRGGRKRRHHGRS